MGEDKAVCFPIDKEQKHVCFRMDNEEELEFGVSPASRANPRLLPELLWWVFSSLPPQWLSVVFNYFVAIPLNLNGVICIMGFFIYTILQSLVMIYPFLNNCWYPYKTSMGPKGKFMIDFIPALAAATLHHYRYNDDEDKGLWQFLELNYGYLFLLLSCSAYFYVIVHFTRRAYDISLKDVMLGLAMQTFCFMVNGALLVRGMALGFCFGISWYRYMTYSARLKMEWLDRMPY